MKYCSKVTLVAPHVVVVTKVEKSIPGNLARSVGDRIKHNRFNVINKQGMRRNIAYGKLVETPENFTMARMNSLAKLLGLV